MLINNQPVSLTAKEARLLAETYEHRAYPRSILTLIYDAAITGEYSLTLLRELRKSEIDTLEHLGYSVVVIISDNDNYGTTTIKW